MIIAIDGPAGSGKSTIAREVAQKLGMRYLDTGAMYRAVTLLAMEAGLVPDGIGEAKDLAAKTDLRIEERPGDLSGVFVDGREVTDEIRERAVSQNVSAVSADSGVRAVLTQKQREEAAKGNVVLEGRDMGTVVVPNADVKVFLTAGVEERARRRRAQLEAQGLTQSLEELVSDINTRDALDSQREIAPLRKADDAVEIDTTHMTILEVVQAVSELAGGRPAPQRASQVQGLEKWPISRMYKNSLDTLLYRITFVVLGPLWRFMYRMKVRGAENVPPTGPVVIVCNHRAMTDPFFIGINVPRQIHYMAKVELWKVGILRWAMEAFGTFPVKRGESDRAAIKRGVEILEQGAILGLFPEGRVTRESTLGPMRPGISLFSAREGVVTVPAVLRGTDQVIRHGILRFPRVELVIGPPLDLPGSEVPRSKRGEIITDRVAAALTELLTTPAD